MVLLGHESNIQCNIRSTYGKAYDKEVVWADAPTVHVFTNTVVVTNTVPVVTERTNIVYVTNVASGAVSGVATREPVATNYVTAIVTNLVPVFMTNVVQMPVTNLVARPEVETAIGAAGSVINTFAPGIGSIVALALGGLYHGYHRVTVLEVNASEAQVHRGLFTGFVQGHQPARGLCLVFGLKALKSFGGVVESVVDTLATEEQPIALFHFHSGARLSLNEFPRLNQCGKSIHKAANSEKSQNC